MSLIWLDTEQDFCCKVFFPYMDQEKINVHKMPKRGISNQTGLGNMPGENMIYYTAKTNLFFAGAL